MTYDDYTEQVSINAEQLQMAAEAFFQMDELTLSPSKTRDELESHIATLIRSLMALLATHEGKSRIR